MTEEEMNARIKVLEDETKRAREEAAERRAKIKEYEDADAKRAAEAQDRENAEAAKKGEFEKILASEKAEREKLARSIAQREAAMRKRLVDEAIRARLADAIDPDIATMLDRKSIEVDAETFEIKGLDDAVKSFREAKPHFFKATESKPDEKRGNSAPPRASSGNGAGEVDAMKLDDAGLASMMASYGL